jgi:pyrroline-5-carboxylate reductase
MQIGLIGAGNMATALARGIGEPVLVADPVRERAEALAAELGGEALASNAEVAERADAIVLCHKPAQLAAVAGELRGKPDAVVSILGGVPVADVETEYPGTPVYRFIPNIPAEVRQGVLCYAPGRLAAEGPEQGILELLGRAGTIIRLDDSLIDTAMALMSCGPGFLALVAEAMVDAGVRQGLQPDDAALMTVETMAGTAAVLREQGLDTAALRRRVTSPGGSTARGLAALERGGIRSAFQDAVGAVVEATKR